MNTLMKTLAMGIIIAFGCLNTLSAQEVSSPKSGDSSTIRSYDYGVEFVYVESGDTMTATPPPIVCILNVNALMKVSEIEHADMYIPSPILCQNDKGELVVLIETKVGRIATPFFSKDGKTDLRMPEGFWIAVPIPKDS